MSTEAVTEKVTHTPGPWWFGKFHTPENTQTNCVKPENDSLGGKGWFSKNINIMNLKGEIIADVKAYTTSGFIQDFDQWAANAKLIVAAPDMLEALKEAIAIADKNLDEKFDGFRAPECQAVYDKCKEAINKATL